MTGTAMAVAEQLTEFYSLQIAVIPPNRPCVREDRPDRLYATAADKEVALVEEISAAHTAGRPVLVGTGDVAESERLARRLRRAGLDPVVLNAKNDADGPATIAEPRAYGASTGSTHVGGSPARDSGGTAASGTAAAEARGGDHDRVAAAGGLLVIGTGRYHSSRLDDQLRGRAGRQGDPGASVFFTSLQDDLVTRYAPDEKTKAAADEDGLITDKGAHWIVGHAQRVAEGVALELHRNTWRYNQLIGLQRRELLAERDAVLHGDAADRAMAADAPERHAELTEIAGPEVVAAAARQVVLYQLDRCWAEHLAFLA